MLDVEWWILARLRNRDFFSLAELNQAIREQLEKLNGRKVEHPGNSRCVSLEIIEDCYGRAPTLVAT